jgi:hypothetical protein
MVVDLFHRSLHKDAPIFRPIQQIEIIRSHPNLGGLHHHYGRIRFFGKLQVVGCWSWRARSRNFNNLDKRPCIAKRYHFAKVPGRRKLLRD